MTVRDSRLKDLLNMLKKLDITPTMHNNAVEKYTNLGNFLNEKGIEANFYPQGSFALGTVVRPYSNDKVDNNFDLDAICEVAVPKKNTDPQLLKEAIEQAFEEDKTYKDKLHKFDKCCTIEYSENGGAGFSIDIISAVEEDPATKQQLNFEQQKYVNTAIAIASKDSDGYDWISNNPKGFKIWFDQINDLFLEYGGDQTHKLIFDSAGNLRYRIYDSIENIPETIERSSLQRVIQILKRHRDVYFSTSKRLSDLKPNSMIITTLAASIARDAPYNSNVFELLNYVVNELNIYSQRRQLNEAQFSTRYVNKNIIKKNNGEWVIENPVNSNDNLADSWNENEEKANAFFNWAAIVSKDFLSAFEKSDADFFTMLENAFGSSLVNTTINKSNYGLIIPAESIKPKQQARPWRKDGN